MRTGTGLLIDSTDVYGNGGVVGNSMTGTGTLLKRPEIEDGTCGARQITKKYLSER